MKFPQVVAFVALTTLLILRGSQAQEDEENMVDPVVSDGDVVTIDGKHLLSAPIFCPSNYRIDSKGRCRRVQ